jgi:hypothetical protein
MRPSSCRLVLFGIERGYWQRDKRVVEKVEECVGAFFVNCSFRSVEDNFEWAFAGFMCLMTTMTRK